MVAIAGYQCVFHSTYKGWDLFRAVNGLTERPMMVYFAASPEGVLLRARSLGQIKSAVTKEVQ